MTKPEHDPEVDRAIAQLAVPGVLIGHRVILPDDAAALWPVERAAFARSVDKVRRASGAARIVARELMPQLGVPPQAIPKAPSGAPIWPQGLAGSLAHDAHVAIAALAHSRDFAGIGVDVEPAAPLDADLLDMVATPAERRVIAGDLLQARVLFAVKEAVYKSVHPIDGKFLDHHDVEVEFAAGIATVRNGRRVRFHCTMASHIVALAII